MKRWYLGAVVFLTLLSARPASAFLTDRCVSVNSISMREGEMRAELSEPSWKPELGLLLVPGQEVPKDPRVTNTSTREAQELVAIRLTFQTEDGKRSLTSEEMQLMSSLLSIDYESDKEGALWRRYEGESSSDVTQHFYYSQALKRNRFLGEDQGESTRPLFTQVSISPLVKNLSFQGLQALQGFHILLEACALEYEGEEGEALNAASGAAQGGDFVWEEENSFSG